MQHMVHGVAFTQIKTRYDKVMDKLKEISDKRNIIYRPLILSLAQLTSKLNYENLMKILELFSSLITQLQE